MKKLMFVTAAVLMLALALPASAAPYRIDLSADNLSTPGIITDKDQSIPISIEDSLLVNSFSTIRAQLKDKAGNNNTTSGVVITFSVSPQSRADLTNATLTGKAVSASTDANGIATVLLKCLRSDVVAVTAKNNSLPKKSTNIKINQTIYRITLTASPQAINVSKNATLYAQIKDKNGNNISDNVWIKFQVENSSVGYLIHKTSSGSVVYAQTNAKGLATVKFQGTALGKTRIYAFGAYEKDKTAVLIPGWKSVIVW